MFKAMFGFGFLVTALVAWHQARKWQMVVDSPDDDTRCAVCDSALLRELGEKVYVCEDCGYEGGSGRAALNEATRLEKDLALDAQSRQARIREEIERARDALVTALGFVATARALSKDDVIGMSSDFGQAKQDALAGVGREMLVASQHMRTAAAIEGREHAVEGTGIDLGQPIFIADLYLDNFITDLLVHKRIDALGERAQQMLGEVEVALGRLG